MVTRVRSWGSLSFWVLVFLLVSVPLALGAAGPAFGASAEACTVVCRAVVPQSAPAGVSVQLTALAEYSGCTGTPVYDWTFGDGTANTSEQNPFHTYQDPGDYTWKAKADVGNTGWSQSGTIHVSAPQAPQGTTWGRHIGMAGLTERGTGRVRATPDGNYILACTTYPEGSSKRDLWFLKTDFYGAVIGSTVFPSAGDEEPYDIRTTTDGGAIIAAYGDSFSRAGGGDAWLVRLDSSGNCAWQKAYGTGNLDRLRSVVQTADGGFLAVGSTAADSGDYDLWVVKVDSAGELMWQRKYGGSKSDFGYCVANTSDGYTIVAGETLSFGAGEKDIWVLKLDAAGSVLWQKAYGGPAMEFMPVVREISPGGGYFVAANTASFGEGNYDGLFLKLDPVGQVVAATTAGGFGWDEFHAMEVTADGGAILSGYTDRQATGMGFAWLLRVDPAGDSSVPLLWQRAVGASGYDDFYGVTETEDGGFTASGNTIEYGIAVLLLHTDSNGNMVSDCPLWVPATAWNAVVGMASVTTTATSLAAGAAAAETHVQGSPYGVVDAILCAPPCEIVLSAIAPRETGAGLSTQFTSRLSAILCNDASFYAWDFGDGTTSSEPNPWHTYAAQGDYAWSLTGGAGALTKTVQGTIAVAPAVPVQGETWMHHYGDTPTERSEGGIRTTADGGYILGCYTYPPQSTIPDAWLLNLTPLGQIVRQEAFHGEAWEEPEDLQPTPDGGAIIACSTESYGAGGMDAWLIKLDPSGVPVWQKVYGGPGLDKINSVVPTSDGGYAAAGITTTTEGGWDLWVLKLDGEGLVTWQKAYGGSNRDYAMSIRQTSDGGYIVAGVTLSYSYASADVWLLKLDPSGGLSWSRTYGGEKLDYQPTVRVTAAGNYLFSGIYETSANRYDGFLVCVAPDADLIWARTYGGYGNDYFYNMEALPDGGAVVAGYYDNRTMGSGDGWVLRVDSDGHILWQRVLGGPTYDSFYGVSVGADQGITLAGDTISWGPGGDAWAVHLDANGNLPPECGQGKVPATVAEGMSLFIGEPAVASRVPSAVASALAVSPAPYTAADTATCNPSCVVGCTATVPAAGFVLGATWFSAEATLTGCTEPATYFWTLGDGTTVPYRHFAYGYQAPGTYDWSVEVMADGVMCLQTGTITITESPCTVECSATVPAMGFVGSATHFVAQATLTGCTEPATFTWYFGDGNSYAGSSLAHAYLAPGTYSWYVEVTAQGFTCIKAGTIVVTVSPCTIECAATVPATGVALAPIPFAAEATLTGCTEPATYRWNFGDGATADSQGGTHAYLAPGSYDWAVTVTAQGFTVIRAGAIVIGAGLPGDGDGNGVVSIGEVQQSINMFLGIQVPGNGADCSGDGVISIGEVQKVINAFLGLPAACS